VLLLTSASSAAYLPSVATPYEKSSQVFGCDTSVGVSGAKNSNLAINYHEPSQARPKGCGKRLKGDKEKALKKAQKYKRRRCNGCNKVGVSHDKRNCPELNKKGKEELNNEEELKNGEKNSLYDKDATSDSTTDDDSCSSSDSLAVYVHVTYHMAPGLSGLMGYLLDVSSLCFLCVQFNDLKASEPLVKYIRQSKALRTDNGGPCTKPWEIRSWFRNKTITLISSWKWRLTFLSVLLRGTQQEQEDSEYEQHAENRDTQIDQVEPGKEQQKDREHEITPTEQVPGETLLVSGDVACDTRQTREVCVSRQPREDGDSRQTREETQEEEWIHQTESVAASDLMALGDVGWDYGQNNEVWDSRQTRKECASGQTRDGCVSRQSREEQGIYQTERVATVVPPPHIREEELLIMRNGNSPSSERGGSTSESLSRIHKTSVGLNIADSKAEKVLHLLVQKQ
ncbi:hypothetical protein IFM89_008019, partial [Coptis chinensis]